MIHCKRLGAFDTTFLFYEERCHLSRMSLIHMNRLSRTVCKQPLLSEFPSNATLLVARKISSWMRFAKAIEPDCPNLELTTPIFSAWEMSAENMHAPRPVSVSFTRRISSDSISHDRSGIIGPIECQRLAMVLSL